MAGDVSGVAKQPNLVARGDGKLGGRQGDSHRTVEVVKGESQLAVDGADGDQFSRLIGGDQQSALERIDDLSKLSPGDVLHFTEVFIARRGHFRFHFSSRSVGTSSVISRAVIACSVFEPTN